MDKFFTDLVGTKVTLNISPIQTPFGPINSYSISDKSFLDKINARDECIRLRVPGVVFTAEMQTGRVNIHIDENGKITSCNQES